MYGPWGFSLLPLLQHNENDLAKIMYENLRMRHICLYGRSFIHGPHFHILYSSHGVSILLLDLDSSHVIRFVEVDVRVLHARSRYQALDGYPNVYIPYILSWCRTFGFIPG